MKVLIGYDGSPGAEAALEDLRRAGLPAKVDARVLSIAEVFLPQQAVPDQPERAPDPSDPRFQALREASDLAERAKRTLLEMFPEWRVEAIARADSPAWGIIKEADTWNPELVVVGSEGRSRLGRFLLGSVSHKVLTESRATVRVARARSGADTLIRLLAGIDGSPGSDAALATVLSRTWPPSTELLLLAVLDPRMSTGLIPSPFTHELWAGATLDEQKQWIEDILRKADEAGRGSGLATKSILEVGDPKERLVEQAKEWGADCIFVGARGLTGMDRFLLGSVSTAVAMRAPCSVEIVHGPAHH
jgi:nucleotide-binding universal stress UspA family protein